MEAIVPKPLPSRKRSGRRRNKDGKKRTKIHAGRSRKSKSPSVRDSIESPLDCPIILSSFYRGAE